MKKLLIALTIVLLMFTFVSCSGDTPAPDVPEAPEPETPVTPVEPDPEPEPEPREAIDFFNADYKWVGIRHDKVLEKDYKIELVPLSEDNFSITFTPGFNDYMDRYYESTSWYKDRFKETVFDIHPASLFDYAIKTYSFHVNYHNEEAVIGAVGEETKYYPYYIRFTIFFDYCTPDADTPQSHVYNRFVYATLADEQSLFEYYEGSPYLLTLVPTGTAEQNEYFTDEKKEEIIKSWYENIFKGEWAGEATSVGIGDVELVEGTGENPEKIQFVMVEGIPDVSGDTLDNCSPLTLISYGEFTREPNN